MQPQFKPQLPSISDEEFTQLAKLIYDKIGIFLPKSKIPLLTVRLQKILSSLGLSSFGEYYQHLINDKSGESLSLLATKISTNYTYFYREEAHFEYFLQTSLPEIASKLRTKNDYKLRVWTAGCSSGEEPYMLDMLMREYFGTEYSKWDAGVLATDISVSVLDTARHGIYPKESIERVPPGMRNKYFKKYDDESVQVIDEIRRDLTFRRYNLMNVKPPFKRPFHIIFCRNVMIYFDQVTRNALVSRFIDLLEPGGYLFIGHSETVDKSLTALKPIIPAVYQKI